MDFDAIHEHIAAVNDAVMTALPNIDLADRSYLLSALDNLAHFESAILAVEVP